MSAHWHWQQWTLLILIVLEAGIALGKHGEPRTGKYSFWNTGLSCVIYLWLLFGGGFFR